MPQVAGVVQQILKAAQGRADAGRTFVARRKSGEEIGRTRVTLHAEGKNRRHDMARRMAAPQPVDILQLMDGGGAAVDQRVHQGACAEGRGSIGPGLKRGMLRAGRGHGQGVEEQIGDLRLHRRGQRGPARRRRRRGKNLAGCHDTSIGVEAAASLSAKVFA